MSYLEIPPRCELLRQNKLMREVWSSPRGSAPLEFLAGVNSLDLQQRQKVAASGILRARFLLIRDSFFSDTKLSKLSKCSNLLLLSCIVLCLSKCMLTDTIGGQSVRLPSLRVSGVDSGLLHAAELGLPGVRRHGRGRRCGENVGVRSGVGWEKQEELMQDSLGCLCGETELSCADRESEAVLTQLF